MELKCHSTILTSNDPRMAVVVGEVAHVVIVSCGGGGSGRSRT